MDESYDTVAIIRKEIFNFTDTYVINVKDPENALDALMFVLAIDAEKCTRNKRQNFFSTQFLTVPNNCTMILAVKRYKC